MTNGLSLPLPDYCAKTGFMGSPIIDYFYRGNAMPFLAALNPIHWLLIAFVGLSAVLGALYHFQGKEFELEKARHAAFVAETKAVGLVQERQGKEKHEKDVQEKKNADSQIQAARNSLVAYADRLRQQAGRPGARVLPSPSSGSPSIAAACLGSQDDGSLAGYSDEMAAIRREVNEIVIEGAEAELVLNGARRWAQSR